MSDAGAVSLLNLLSGVVALLISYYAYRNNKLVDSIPLRYISAGFLLLGVSLFLQAGTENLASTTAIEALRVRGVELVAFLLYTALQLIAYGVFAWGYALSFLSRTSSSAGSIPAVIATASTVTRKTLEGIVLVLAIYLASQAAIVVLLSLIVFHAARVFSRTQSNLALMVLFGFALILAAHVIMLAAALTLAGTAYLVGNTIEFCGFVSLLFFLFWSGRVVR